ncbi:hypothetical protein B0J14DRAFT_324591 [Halenospora varia]|nr:hypothetical protein B0J14DRAFT_324591 [Halenospora varia]
MFVFELQAGYLVSLCLYGLEPAAGVTRSDVRSTVPVPLYRMSNPRTWFDCTESVMTSGFPVLNSLLAVFLAMEVMPITPSCTPRNIFSSHLEYRTINVCFSIQERKGGPTSKVPVEHRP